MNRRQMITSQCNSSSSNQPLQNWDGTPLTLPSNQSPHLQYAGPQHRSPSAWSEHSVHSVPSSPNNPHMVMTSPSPVDFNAQRIGCSPVNSPEAGSSLHAPMYPSPSSNPSPNSNQAFFNDPYSSSSSIQSTPPQTPPISSPYDEIYDNNVNQINSNSGKFTEPLHRSVYKTPSPVSQYSSSFNNFSPIANSPNHINSPSSIRNLSSCSRNQIAMNKVQSPYKSPSNQQGYGASSNQVIIPQSSTSPHSFNGMLSPGQRVNLFNSPTANISTLNNTANCSTSQLRQPTVMKDTSQPMSKSQYEEVQDIEPLPVHDIENYLNNLSPPSQQSSSSSNAAIQPIANQHPITKPQQQQPQFIGNPPQHPYQDGSYSSPQNSPGVLLQPFNFQSRQVSPHHSVSPGSDPHELENQLQNCVSPQGFHNNNNPSPAPEYSQTMQFQSSTLNSCRTPDQLSAAKATMPYLSNTSLSMEIKEECDPLPIVPDHEIPYVYSNDSLSNTTINQSSSHMTGKGNLFNERKYDPQSSRTSDQDMYLTSSSNKAKAHSNASSCSQKSLDSYSVTHFGKLKTANNVHNNLNLSSHQITKEMKTMRMEDPPPSINQMISTYQTKEHHEKLPVNKESRIISKKTLDFSHIMSEFDESSEKKNMFKKKSIKGLNSLNPSNGISNTNLSLTNQTWKRKNDLEDNPDEVLPIDEDSSINGIASPTDDEIPNEPKKKKRRKKLKSANGIPENGVCLICGDVAKNYHFGGLACDSCKAFFRRSVQSKAWKNFSCPNKCVITQENRRACQYCRFQKCLSIGMEMDQVMTQGERMSLLKCRIAKSRSQAQEKEKSKIYGELPHSLDPQDAIEINDLLYRIYETFRILPFPKECEGDTFNSLCNVFAWIAKQFTKFYMDCQHFEELCTEDQGALLKQGIGQAIYIYGAHICDSENQSFPHPNTHESMKCPLLTLPTVQAVAQFPEAFSSLMHFYYVYQADMKDHAVMVLTTLIALFHCGENRDSFSNPTRISDTQEMYIELLKRYLIARDGWQSIHGLLPKILNIRKYIDDILKHHLDLHMTPTINIQDDNAIQKFSHKNSMKVLTNQIQQSSMRNLPQYASIYPKRQAKTIFTKSNLFYHPKTIELLGKTHRTDMILGSPFQEEDDSRKLFHKRQLSIEYPMSRQYNAHEIVALNSYKYKEQDESNKKRNKCTKNGQCSKNYTNPKSICSPSGSRPDNGSIENRIVSTNYHRNSEVQNYMSQSSHSDDKILNVGKICHLLNLLLTTNDPEVIKNAKKSIPKNVLENLSQWLTKQK